MIAIVNYGVGNLYSLRCSLESLGVACRVTDKAGEIAGADQVILPGVGAFGDAAAKLRERGLDSVVIAQARAGKPLLGICLGMQLLYGSSSEYGEHKGLGLVPGRVTALREDLDGQPLKVPHMGWNALEPVGDCPLLHTTKPGSYVYYVHSFYARVGPHTAGFSRYGPAEVTGVVQNGNVFGTQFHPEKSGAVGLRMLKAFSEIK